jgi:hypothetical protein
VRRKKRKERRQFTDVARSVKGLKRRLNYLTLGSNGREWTMKTLHPNDLHRTHSSVQIRRSNRWLTRQKSPQTSVELPFIDHVGKFTGTNLYHVNLSPSQFIGTVISTVYKRVYGLVVRRNGRLKRTRNRWSTLLLRCSAYYALTKNAYFWDRLLPLLRKGDRGTVSKMLHKFVCKLDDYKWFVYSHACSQAKWLTFRALGPRDKSSYVRDYFYKTPSGVLHEQSRSSFEYDAVWHVFTEMSRV